MRYSLFAGVFLISAFGPLSQAVQAQPEPREPTEREVMRAAQLPPFAVEKGVVIVKERTDRGQWRCTVYYYTTEPVRLPWGGWVPVPKARTREVLLGRAGPIA